jgi:hypothetical protein
MALGLPVRKMEIPRHYSQVLIVVVPTRLPLRWRLPIALALRTSARYPRVPETAFSSLRAIFPPHLQRLERLNQH